MTGARPARGAGTAPRVPRVALVSRIFAPEPAAASFRLESLARALGRGGARVRVLTTTARRDLRAAARACDEDLREARVVVDRAPVLRDRTGYVRGYLQYLSFDVPAFVRLLAEPRPDVVVCEPPPTTGAVVRAVCALRRVPYVYYAADVWSDATAGDGATPGIVSRVLAAVEGWAMRGAAGVVAVSPDVAARVHALVGAPGAEPGAAAAAPRAAGASTAAVRRGRRPDVVVVRNGIDTDVFRPGLPRPEQAPARYVVYAGTTSAWQGADVFVRAMPVVRAAVPDAELVILGQGSDWDELGRLAAQHAPGAVHLRPLVPAAEAAAWLGAASGALVSVRPGAGYDMALPTKTFAAAACGTPVVFAGPGPAGPIVRDGGLGHAVAYDVDEVAAAMIAVLRADDDAAARAERSARLAAWARDNASIAQVGQAVAAHVRRWRERPAPAGATTTDGDDAP